MYLKFTPIKVNFNRGKFRGVRLLDALSALLSSTDDGDVCRIVSSRKRVDACLHLFHR
jgi:hypothetical protein